MIDSGVADVTGRLRSLLAESPIAEVRHVRVELKGDRVFLRGRVRSFYAKQMAQETVRQAGCMRNLDIENCLAVD